MGDVFCSCLSLRLPVSLLLGSKAVFPSSDHSHSSASLSDVPPPSMTITSDREDLEVRLLVSKAASLSFLLSVTSSQEVGVSELAGG